MAEVNSGKDPQSSSKPDIRTVTTQGVVHRTLTRGMRKNHWYQQTDLALNGVAVLRNLLYHLDVKVSYGTLKETLLANNGYPDILSLAESLQQWNIKCLIVKLPHLTSTTFDLPAVAHVSKDTGYYLMIKSISNLSVRYLDPTSGWMEEPIEQFEKRWTGVLLVPEVGVNAGEQNYRMKVTKEKFAKLKWPFAVSAIVLWFILFYTVGQITYNNKVDQCLIFLIISAIGASLSILMLIKELGSEITFLDKFCKVLTKGGCNAVLEAPSKIYGLKLSEIGLIYFSGNFLCLILSFQNEQFHQAISFIALLNLLAVLFSLFSIGYMILQVVN